MIHCVICVKGVEDTKLERCQAMITLTMQCNDRMFLIQHLNHKKLQQCKYVEVVLLLNRLRMQFSHQILITSDLHRQRQIFSWKINITITDIKYLLLGEQVFRVRYCLH